MPEQPLPPPPAHPDEPPFVCVQINQSWIPYIIGLLRPAKFPEYWSGTLAENRNARRDVQNLIYQFQNREDCGDMASNQDCCIDIQVLTQVNVDTGNIEISIDNGLTWQPKGGTVKTFIPNPVPPVTSGVSANKCDAATNGMAQFQYWIDHTSDAFDIAVTLLEFAILVAGIIANAVLLIVTGGGITAFEAAIFEVLGAALAAVWAGGKTLFANYWTVEVKDNLVCALYCHIGEDGSFTEAQFQAFRRNIRDVMPAGAAKTLFLGFIDSVSRQGLNSMCASGATGDADCSDCSCNCNWNNWEIWIGGGTILTQTSSHIIVQGYDRGDGAWEARVRNPNITDCCCKVRCIVDGVTYNPTGQVGCGYANDDESNIGFGYLDGAVNAIAFQKLWDGAGGTNPMIVEFVALDPC